MVAGVTFVLAVVVVASGKVSLLVCIYNDHYIIIILKYCCVIISYYIDEWQSFGAFFEPVMNYCVNELLETMPRQPL